MLSRGFPELLNLARGVGPELLDAPRKTFEAFELPESGRFLHRLPPVVHISSPVRRKLLDLVCRTRCAPALAGHEEVVDADVAPEGGFRDRSLARRLRVLPRPHGLFDVGG